MSFVIVSVTVVPRKGRRPVAASYRTTPSEKMSVRGASDRPKACSGDMYWIVPTIIPCWVMKVVGVSAAGASEVTPTCLAMPKSRTFTRLPLTMMLSGLMSRWTMPFACASARASATPRPMRQISASAIGPRLMSADNGWPSTSSMTMKRWSVSCSNEWMVAMLGW